MALTQRFARVTPEYLERCRASALDSPGSAPGWNPPSDDLLDTDWAIWGLISHCRSTGVDPAVTALLDRAVSGDPGGDIGFLDHDEVYDDRTASRSTLWISSNTSERCGSSTPRQPGPAIA